MYENTPEKENFKSVKNTYLGYDEIDTWQTASIRVGKCIFRVTSVFTAGKVQAV